MPRSAKASGPVARNASQRQRHGDLSTHIFEMRPLVAIDPSFQALPNASFRRSRREAALGLKPVTFELRVGKRQIIEVEVLQAAQDRLAVQQLGSVVDRMLTLQNPTNLGCDGG